MRKSRHRVHRTDARATPRIRPQAHCPRDRSRARRADARRHRLARRRERSLAGGHTNRLPGDAEEHGRRRRHRHARVLERGRTGGAVRCREAPRSEQLQRRGRLHRKVHRACASPRSAGLRRRSRQRARARRARLLGAAAQPESARRNARAVAARRHVASALRSGAAACESGELPLGGHRRIRLRQRRRAVLFPRSKYAPASRTRRDRAGVGRRSRALDDRAGGRHAGSAR